MGPTRFKGAGDLIIEDKVTDQDFESFSYVSTLRNIPGGMKKGEG